MVSALVDGGRMPAAGCQVVGWCNGCRSGSASRAAMRAVSSVARSEVAGFAKAARAVKGRVGTVVGASVGVLSGSCSNVTLCGAAGGG